MAESAEEGSAGADFPQGKRQAERRLDAQSSDQWRVANATSKRRENGCERGEFRDRKRVLERMSAWMNVRARSLPLAVASRSTAQKELALVGQVCIAAPLAPAAAWDMAMGHYPRERLPS